MCSNPTLSPRFFQISIALWLVLIAFLQPVPTVYAAPSLTITPITWNVVGLDSNDVNVGPNNFPVGARVCNTGDTAATNVTPTFVWDTTDVYINLRPGSYGTAGNPYPAVASLSPGACTDFYYEVQITRNSSAYNHTARYHITATATGLGTISTPTPREIFVEHLISQNRNATTDVRLNGVSIPAGGTMSLLVGKTYTITLVAATATQGYNQIETFVNFPNTIFQVLSVSTTYSADSSLPPTGYVPNPNDKLYGDGCLWDNDPDSPTYRSCTGIDGKAGGNITVSYQVRIISGAGTSQTLTSLIYDFSGSSFHYNADYTAGARIASIIGPSTVTIQKTFTPKAIAPGSTSVMSFKLTNPIAETLTGVNFSDSLPSGVLVHSTPGVSYSGCGSGAFAPALTGGETSVSFANGTLSPNSVCTINVTMRAASAGTYPNTTGHLFINTSTDTGNTGSDTLTVASASACTPGQTLARWTVPSTATNPPDSSGAPTTKGANVSTATASSYPNGKSVINATIGSNDTYSWDTYGYKNDGGYVQFVIDTRQYSNVSMAFYSKRDSNGPTSISVYYDNGSGETLKTTYNASSTPPYDTTWRAYTLDFTGNTSTSGNTTFRILWNWRVE
jgi:hypothetical protein